MKQCFVKYIKKVEHLRNTVETTGETIEFKPSYMYSIRARRFFI